MKRETKTMTKIRKPVRESKTHLSYLIENELEKTELILTVRSITDELQDMAQKLAKIDADEIMPLSDSLKTAFGPQLASQFSNATKAKIQELVTGVSAAKDAISAEIDRLENAANGEPSNDMAMDAPEGDGSDMGAGDAVAGPSPDVEPNPDMDGAEPDMGDEDQAEGGEEDNIDMKMNAAGRAKKESTSRPTRGRRLVEYTSANFDTNLNNLTAWDTRAGAQASAIHQMIDAGKFDGNERAELANILSHLAMCANDQSHWEDPDAKVEAAIRATNADSRVPEVRAIIAKIKKLAHYISLKHDGMVESKKLKANIKKLSESKNPDTVILKEFRRLLAETKNTILTVKMVAEKFSIDGSDVISIVKEAKKNTRVESVKKKSDAKNIVKEFDMTPTPKSKRGMFKGVAQADLQKRLTAAKHEMKAKEDKGEAVPHALRSKVSQLEFALRAKHKWGKVKEAEESKQRWSGLVDADCDKVKSKKPKKEIDEQTPLKPKSPEDMRNDRSQGQTGTRQVTGAASNQKPNNNAQSTGKPNQNQATNQQPPMFARGSNSSTPTSNQAPPQTMANPNTPVGQKMASTDQEKMAPNQDGTTPSGSTTPGQSPQKPQAMPSIPGKVMTAVPNTPAATMTLMSKMDKPFPKPQSPLMGTGGVSESKRKIKR